MRCAQFQHASRPIADSKFQSTTVAGVLRHDRGEVVEGGLGHGIGQGAAGLADAGHEALPRHERPGEAQRLREEGERLANETDAAALLEEVD